ncbi:SWIM zinc finger domain-containing protein [Paenibacillus sp. P36]|uniref:SWIM zinc finger family protein n=1 Tax=Paenibacillus sp. P36 TaxID=3342538 RepID=UPI0038B251A7
MHILSFEDQISRVIINHGYNYYMDDLVSTIEEINENLFAATVEGSDDYNVVIALKEDGEIHSHHCTCPFEGPVCKHQVAVFYELRAEWEENMFDGKESQVETTFSNKSKESAVNDGKDTKVKRDIRSILAEQSKEDLVEFILLMIQEDQDVAKQVRLHFERGDVKTELSTCYELIRSHIKKHVDRHGFIAYGKVSQAIRGGELVLERAINDWRADDPLSAIHFCFCVMHEMIDLLQGADDSDGAIGELIEDSLETATRLDLDAMTPDKQAEIFRVLLAEAMASRYDEWSDWRHSLLDACAELSQTRELCEALKQAITQLELRTVHSDYEWSANHEREALARLRYKLLDEAEKEAFLLAQLDKPSFREEAIRQAIEAQRYDDAIRLAEQGELSDQERGLPGLVTKWKMLRYEACAAASYTEQMRELAFDLTVDGDYTYYLELKQLYSEASWQEVYERLMQQMGQKDYNFNNVYIRIMQDTNDHARLLKYVQGRPYEIVDYYADLAKHYPDEMRQLFRGYIELRASNANNRSQYKHVAKLLVTYKQACGPDHAEALHRQFLSGYVRRTAFCEELRKITSKIV